MFNKIVPVLLISLFCSCSNNPYPDPGNRKVIYAVIQTQVNTLDPVRISDSTSAEIGNQIYSTLYQYHYLKRPYKVIPNLASGMPVEEIKKVKVTGKTGKTIDETHAFYTFTLKKGILFHDDPCFKKTNGKGREVIIDDFIYSIKRLADPNTNSTGYWLINGRISGIDEFHKYCASTKKPDYSKSISGIKKINRYSVKIEFFEPFPAMASVLTLTYFAPVPHEAVEYYNRGENKEFNRHPVGTGAFRLKEWKKNEVLILERNPDYMEDFYPSEGEETDRAAGLLESADQRLPLVDEIRYTFMYESVPAWIYFLQGYREISGISKDNWNKVLSMDLSLNNEYVKKGIKLYKIIEPATYYLTFNMNDSIVGKNKFLRQAISCALDFERINDIFFNNRLPIATQILPPGVFGYNPDLINPYKGRNLKKAEELLLKSGYPGGVNKKDKKRLHLVLDTAATDASAKQRNLEIKNQIEDIGIELEIRENTWPELLKRMHAGTLQMFISGWIMDYPDPENFLQLFYSENVTPGPNNSNYKNKNYDILYRKIRYMRNTPERLEIIKKMVDILTEDVPVVVQYHSAKYVLKHSWYKNYKLLGITGNYMKYRDVDVKLRDKMRKTWNKPKYNYLFVSVAIILFLVLIGIIRKKQG